MVAEQTFHQTKLTQQTKFKIWRHLSRYIDQTKTYYKSIALRAKKKNDYFFKQVTKIFYRLFNTRPKISPDYLPNAFRKFDIDKIKLSENQW